MAVPAWLVKKPILGLGLGTAGAVLALSLWALGWLETIEAKTWDWRASFLARKGAATDQVVMILLDQKSLDWARIENGLSWPWPREVYGAIINFCRRNGAKALAFDVLFTEPSKYGVEDDVSFGKAVSEFGSFAGSLFLGDTTGSETRWPEEIPRPGFRISGLDGWLSQREAKRLVFPRATFPIPELSGNAAVLCNVHLEPDKDGVYRRVKIFSVFDGVILPSLGFGTHLAADPDISMEIGPGGLTAGRRTIPVDREGNLLLRYRGPSGTYKNYSAAAVLQSEISALSGGKPAISDPEALKDKYVIFGFSAPGLYDLRPSPVDGVYPGTEIHATALDNFLSGDFMKSSPGWLNIMIVLTLTLSCGVLASVFRSPAGSLALAALFFSLPVVISMIAYVKGLWLPLVLQEAAAASTLSFTLVVNYATEGRQKRFIKAAFKQYLSPAVIEELIKNPQRLKLGGERRILSIFFSDLQGFTSISEGLDPESLTSLLNDYLSAMTDIIHEEGGTVDKYEGDAIIAFWNAPMEVPDHATRIVRASLRCQARLAELRPRFRERIGKEMLMRIGVNTGHAVVGNLGSRSRFDYTMLGDAVNLAARLEGVNKQFGTYTIISEATQQMMGNAFASRELARVAVVGRKEPVRIYEPMFGEEYETRKEIMKRFSGGLNLFYEGRFEEAIEVFSGIEKEDPPAAAYKIKCMTLAESRPADWQGVWIMTSK